MAGSRTGLRAEQAGVHRRNREVNCIDRLVHRISLLHRISSETHATMPCRIDRTGFAVLVAAVFGVATLAALARAPSPPRTALIYLEPDDPIFGVLVRASRRINSDDPQDYTAEASAGDLRELDEAIATRPLDPRLHWWRSLALARMKRTPLARTARRGHQACPCSSGRR